MGRCRCLATLFLAVLILVVLGTVLLASWQHGHSADGFLEGNHHPNWEH